MSGRTIGIPQVLLNEAPVQRAPWCLKAMIDREGKPAKSRFTLLRPDAAVVSLTALWALMNSPVANAWAYTHSTKRNILTGTVRRLPVPELGTLNFEAVERAANDYFSAVSDYEQPFPLRGDDAREKELESLRTLHWRMDAAVLRLYALPVELEHELLSFFAGWERAGVPFKQDRYFPEGFDEAISLTDFLAITADWDATNKRRHDLIEKKSARALPPEEATELKQLQRLGGLKRELLASPSLNELRGVEADLRRRGLWQGA
jgi:hypothetical protein